MTDTLVIIGWWDNEEDRHITIQDFVRDGERFIPLFSDVERFKAEATGSGFEDKGLEIGRNFLRDLLNGDELLILNPASEAIRLRKADL